MIGSLTIVTHIAVAAVAAWAAYRTVIMLHTYRSVRAAHQEIAALAGGENRFMHEHPDRRKLTTKSGPFASPDIAYSACAFDLRRGPVDFQCAGSHNYLSLSFYSARGEPFFERHDIDAGAEGIRIILVRKGTRKIPTSRIEHVVTAPTSRGVAFLRYFIPSEGEIGSVFEKQKLSTCTLLEAYAD